MSTATKPRSRGVPVVYGGVTAALLLAVVGLALSSPPPRTPPLAAVAPQVDEQVEVERVEQSSQFGQGAGGEGDCAPGDAGCAAAGAPVDQAQGQVIPQATSAPADFWPCILGPGGARQTEDPQSPPCIAERFKGDNGGATTRGVTATTIRIAVPRQADGDLTDAQEVLEPLLAHFNRSYELYGRRIELVTVPVPEGDVRDPGFQRAFAREVHAAGVLASLHYPVFGMYQEELARSGVLAMVDAYGSDDVREADLTRLHPHVWALYPSVEDAAQATGNLICTALAGRPARHGGEDVSGRPRLFGIVDQASGHGAGGDAGRLVTTRLETCGAGYRFYEHRAGEADDEVLLRRLRDDGVTTVVCFGCGLEPFQNTAETLGFRPEWLLPATRDVALYLRQRAHTDSRYPRAQLAHTFGLSAGLRRPALDSRTGNARWSEQYWFHAARQADPDFTPKDSLWVHNYYGYYAQLLMLASGIQWAGPDLTPETFAAALTGLRYANPGVGVAPWFQPAVGFGTGDHSFNSDFALQWWRDPSDAGYESRTDVGEMCYVGNGSRFTAVNMPADADARFFDPGAGCR